MEAMVCMRIYDDVPFAEIARRCRTFTSTVCESTVRNTFKRWEATGVVDYKPRKSRARKMPADLVNFILSLLETRPWLYLDELATAVNAMSRRLDGAACKTYSRQYVHEQLVACGWSLKKMRAKAAERDEANRELYWRAISVECTSPDQLMFADETALDGRALRRKYGWAARGHRVDVTHIFHRGKMISILAIYTTEGFQEFSWVEGAFDSEKFLAAMAAMLPRVMRPWPQPNSILVLDNCRIHHAIADDLLHIIHTIGGKLLYLAPYCPIDSPIEFGFNCFKAFCRRYGEVIDLMETTDAVRYALTYCYAESGASALSTYRECGYNWGC